MLKVYLKLRAKKDVKTTGWKEGEICELENNVFDEKVGVAYHSIDDGWEILEMKIVEYKPIHL